MSRRTPLRNSPTAIIAFAAALLVAAPEVRAENPDARINALIGDVSWTARTGRAPGPQDSEADRIRTHLRFVISLLRERKTSSRPERAELLEALDGYVEAGRFPRNQDVAGRAPRFIDDRGHLCAVGFLMVASGHRALAEALDRDHEYDRIPAILAGRHGREVVRWARDHGFSAAELAMIQPQYGFEPYRRTPLSEETLREFVTSHDYNTKECLRRQFGTTKPAELSIELRVARNLESESPLVDAKKVRPDVAMSLRGTAIRGLELRAVPALSKRTEGCIREPIEYFYRNLPLHYIVPKTPMATTIRYHNLNVLSKVVRTELRHQRAAILRLVKSRQRQLNRCLTNKHPSSVGVKVRFFSDPGNKLSVGEVQWTKLEIEGSCISSALGFEYGRPTTRATEPIDAWLYLKRPARPDPYVPPYERHPYGF